MTRYCILYLFPSISVIVPISTLSPIGLLSSQKKNKIKVDRVAFCDVDKSQLPDDAKFQGYQSVIVQDIIIKTDTRRAS